MTSPKLSLVPCAITKSANRPIALRAEWACSVVKDPECPVLIASRNVAASAPRNSPRMIRSVAGAAWPARACRQTGVNPVTLRDEIDGIGLAWQKLEGILNRDDPPVRGDHFQKLAAQLGLAGRGAARDDDIQPLGDQLTEEGLDICPF